MSDEKKGRRDNQAGHPEFSGKKKSGTEGADSEPPTRKRHETAGLHPAELETAEQRTEKIDSGKRTSDGRMDKV